MKKTIATILSALVILSFAGVVLAAEPAATLPAGHPPVKAETKKAKKVKKAKKAVKAEEAKPAVAPAAK